MDKENITVSHSKLIETMYKNNRLSFFITVVFVILQAVFDILLAYLMQIILDLVETRDLTKFVFGCIMILIYTAANFFIYAVIRKAKCNFIKRAMTQYKEYAFNKVIHKNFGFFASENNATYISALTNDALSIETDYLDGVFKIISMICWLVLGLAAMLFYSVPMTVAVCLISTLPIMVSFFCTRNLVKYQKDVSEANKDFVGIIDDLLSGFTVFKSFKAEKEILKQFIKTNNNLAEKRQKYSLTTEMIDMMSTCVNLFVQLSIIACGVYFAIKDQLSVGTIFAFVQLNTFVLSPIESLPILCSSRSAARGLIEKLEHELEKNNSHQDQIVKSAHFSGEIIIDNVSFGYKQGEDILKNFSFTFERGKSYAIVGASGCGKTTFLSLISGALKGYRGNIYYDRHDLKNISYDDLYDNVSILQQNSVVFDASIEENITLFKQCPKEKLEQLVSLSGLNELVEKKGLEYSCGIHGKNLSGGEKQRVSIARCLLKEGKILLADEATSALDKISTTEIIESILNLKDMTKIIVTHNLDENLLKMYDKILVIRKGELCEEGSYDELMKNRKYFYSLYSVLD